MWNLLASPAYFLVVHESRSHVVGAQLFDRDDPIYEEDFRRVLLDRPGMICVDRTIYDFTLEGLEINIPATDVGFMLDQLTKGHRQYGLIAVMGYFHCLLLDDVHALLLKEQLTAKLPEAMAVASSENRAINDAILDMREKNVLEGVLRDVPIEPVES